MTTTCIIHGTLGGCSKVLFGSHLYHGAHIIGNIGGIPGMHYGVKYYRKW